MKFDFIKEKVASMVVGNQLKKTAQQGVTFTNFFTDSFSFFVIMPESETDYSHSFDVLHFLDANRKNPVIFTHEFRVSLLPLKFRQSVLTRGLNDISKWNLPTKNMQDMLAKLRFDASIDLNRDENLYCSLAANLVNAPIKVGFKKPGADKYYNLQILNNEDSPEISYKNFLNCLGMF